VISIGGDINLTNINWIKNSIQTNSRRRDLSEALVNTLSHHSFTQVANKPTRGNTILDLLAINHPQMTEHLDILEGISDHKLISTTVKMTIESTEKLNVKCIFLKNATSKNLGRL
jgi:hypothetical protein